MKRLRRNDRPAGRGGGALVKLATAAAASGSRLEDQYWDARLATVLQGLLTPSGQHTIEAALERLWSVNGRAYDLLADAAEAVIESASFEQAGKRWDALMFVIPLLTWARSRIPSGTLRPAELQALRAQLQSHIFMPGARLSLLNRLLTPDQLPASYYDESLLARELFNAALGEQELNLPAEAVPEAMDFISDARFVLGAVIVPHGQAIFSWAQEEVSLETVQQSWSGQAHAALAPMLAGVHYQVLMPGAFFATLRKTDRESRAFHVEAGVAYLQNLLHRPAAQIGAAFAPFHDRGELVEYRIGLGNIPANEIWHGITWPILSLDEVDSAPGEIRELLQGLGVTHMVEHEHRFPMEYSEEYGDPLFPNAAGETVRAEPPEEADLSPVQLH
jgi:hypothetical protein